MPISIKSMLFGGLLCAAVMAAGCSPRKIPPMTVNDLMEDRVKLDGVLLKCNRDTVNSGRDSDCLNARTAVERLAQQKDPAVEAKKVEDFERSRDQLRSQQDRQRQEQEAKTKVDAYHLPVVPVESTPPPKDPQSPIVGQANQ
jgi:hypothetical protein